jgi:hypothetical protein
MKGIVELLEEQLTVKLKRLENLAATYSFWHTNTDSDDLEKCVKEIRCIERAIREAKQKE